MLGWRVVCEGRREKRKEETGRVGGRGVWVGVTVLTDCAYFRGGGERQEGKAGGNRSPTRGPTLGTGTGTKRKEREQKKETRREGNILLSRESMFPRVTWLVCPDDYPDIPRVPHRYPEIPLLPHTETDSERTDMTMIIYI